METVKECAYSLTQLMRYEKQLSGHLLDCIDVHTDVLRVECNKLKSEPLGE